MFLRILLISAFLFLTSILPSCAQNLAILNKKTINIEFADTLQKRQQGLMNRSKMNYNEGMVFLFEEKEAVNFWMKDMKIPLDLIFISDDKIVKIIKNVPVCQNAPCPIYPSTHKINKVIEVNAGFCEKYLVKKGQRVKIINKWIFGENNV